MFLQEKHTYCTPCASSDLYLIFNLTYITATKNIKFSVLACKLVLFRSEFINNHFCQKRNNISKWNTLFMVVWQGERTDTEKSKCHYQWPWLMLIFLSDWINQIECDKEELGWKWVAKRLTDVQQLQAAGRIHMFCFSAEQFGEYLVQFVIATITNHSQVKLTQFC